MWRREVGLAYWLKNKHSTGSLPYKRKKREKLWRRVQVRNLIKSVQDCPLNIHSRTSSFEGMFHFYCDIKNGLDTFNVVVSQPDPKGPECIETETLIHKAGLIGDTPILPLEFTNEDNVQVRQALLNIVPYCRRFGVGIGPAPVHIPALVQLRLPRTAGKGALISGQTAIISKTSQAFDLPIHQTSVDIESLTDSEKLSFLQEAEHRRGFPSDECELIAFFRHVPIEMISKLHFLNDEKAIIYNISSGLNRSRTRVYDVMVIRDGSNEIHIVPHGTRNRTVVFN
jgi:hypothetical protein